MNMILGPLDHLTLREQFKLLELANEANDHRVRMHAIELLDAYRRPPAFKATNTADAQ